MTLYGRYGNILKEGHLYDEFNTKINSEGHRFCRECARILSYKRGRKK